MRSSTPTMVLGIVGASLGVTVGWIFPYLPMILGIIGLFLVRNAVRDGKRTAGLVLNIINVSLGAVWSVWLLTIIAAFENSGA